MRKLISIILSLLLLIFVFTCAEKNDLVEQSVKASWKVSTPGAQWQDMEDLAIMKGESGTADVEIDLVSLKQEIEGFGGAFNEKGWEALSLLTPEERDKVLKELFDPEEGAKFNICRVPVGASDYAVSRYTHNETKNDYNMNNFSIERDKKRLIPYIKAAMRYRPDLKVWGSAWTPPTWMKTSGEFDGGNMKDDPRIYAAYALYLARFVEEYQKEGINLYVVAVQNEPEVEPHYPSCLWTAKQYLTFIRDHMGPLFEERKVNAGIMMGTICQRGYNQFPGIVLSNPEVKGYVSIVGYQWSGVHNVADTRKRFPKKSIMQTETECGNLYWQPGFKMDRPPNDWDYGSYTWKKIREFFEKGVNSYMLWNMVLDEEGKNIDSQLPWPQNAAVVIDKNTKQAIYTPMFYAFKHVTYFVKPGAHYVSVIYGWEKNAIAFLNPDGELVILLENDRWQPEPVNINFGDYWLTVELPPQSWSTIVVTPLQ
jgi:glucosylceramidase